MLTTLSRSLKVSVDDIVGRVEKLNDSLKEAATEIAKFKTQAQTAAAAAAPMIWVAPPKAIGRRSTSLSRAVEGSWVRASTTSRSRKGNRGSIP